MPSAFPAAFVLLDPAKDPSLTVQKTDFYASDTSSVAGFLHGLEPDLSKFGLRPVLSGWIGARLSKFSPSFRCYRPVDALPEGAKASSPTASTARPEPIQIVRLHPSAVLETGDIVVRSDFIGMGPAFVLQSQVGHKAETLGECLLAFRPVYAAPSPTPEQAPTLSAAKAQRHDVRVVDSRSEVVLASRIAGLMSEGWAPLGSPVYAPSRECFIAFLSRPAA